LRYPRGAGYGVATDDPLHTLPIGEAEVLRHGNDMALLAIGATVMSCLKAAEMLAARGIECTVVNSRFVKPLDERLLTELGRQFAQVVTVEENAVAGGFGSAVAECFERLGMPGVVVHRIGVPDRFIDHATQGQQREMLHLTADAIAAQLNTFLPAHQSLSAGGI